MRYAIVIEKAEHHYAAHAPDVPGCVATGASLEEVRAQMQEALQFHFEATVENHEPIPAPTSLVEYVDVDVPVTAEV